MRCEHYLKNTQPWKRPKRCKRKATGLVTINTGYTLPGGSNPVIVDRHLCTPHTRNSKGVIERSHV